MDLKVATPICSTSCLLVIKFIVRNMNVGARDGVVVCGTMVQAENSRDRVPMR
jgi:hypothetical protein